jgi:hypothetical protein
VYISPEVIFDENAFLFATLHPNAGARYTSEVLLVPEPLSSRAITYSPLNNTPAIPCIPNLLAWTNQQPQTISAVSPMQNSGAPSTTGSTLDHVPTLAAAVPVNPAVQVDQADTSQACNNPASVANSVSPACTPMGQQSPVLGESITALPAPEDDPAPAPAALNLPRSSSGLAPASAATTVASLPGSSSNFALAQIALRTRLQSGQGT